MKAFRILILFIIAISVVSCNKDKYCALFAIPVIKKLSDIRNSVNVTGAKTTNADGKIYVTSKLLFYIAQESGVHVFNNENPANPLNIAFINLAGVHDIAVKGNYLYADNYVDLLVFDISDINHIQLVKTVQNTINFYAAYPKDAEFYDYTTYPNQNEIVTGYRLEKRKRPRERPMFELDAATAASSSTSGIGVVTGTGGSYARFQINKNALYTIDTYTLNVFNINHPTQAYFDKQIYLNQWTGGGQFETLYKQDNYLFVGSTNGMYVVDATDEFNPEFISGFSHATSCDPVVVNGNTAFVTLRSGTTCNSTINDQVDVIDISNISNPTLTSTFLLNQPLGLGVRNNALYICTGTGGLKVFDASDLTGLKLKNSYSENVTDVIALDSHLIAIGKNKIIQYSYGDDFSLQPISTVNF